MEHPYNKVIDLLLLARQEGVEVLVKDERLQLKMDEDKEVGENLLSEIKSNRQLIIDYLTSDDWQALTLNHHHKTIIPFDRRTLPHVPASFSQERMWFMDNLSGSTEYNLPAVLRLKGTLNKEALSSSLQSIIERHEVLRTVFYEQDGQVYQSVKEVGSWAVQFADLSNSTGNGIYLQSFIEKEVKKPFDLSRDFPIRATLIKVGSQDHILVVTQHHIASDAWSTGIIVKEVARLYNAYLNGTHNILQPLPLQYADFSVWQRNQLQEDVLNKKIRYWKDKLEGGETLQLPTSYPRQAAKNIQGATINFTVDKVVTERLHSLCREHGVTLYMLLLSVYKVLLYRYSGQRDITVGTSIASRQQKELEGLVGLFVNTLALRDEIDPAAPFTKLLQQVKTTTLNAYENQDIPFEKVVEVAAKERDAARTPLFQTMLVLANTPESSKLVIGGMELSSEPFANAISKFEITFFVTETPKGLSVTMEYATALYSAAFAESMSAHFTTLIHSVIENPKQQAGLLKILPAKEEHQLLETFNDATVSYSTNKSIVDLFEEQVTKAPGNIAVVFEGEEMTFLQLNEKANQIAYALKSKGAGPGQQVALYMERSGLMMAGMLGILKSGAAYVPVDTDFPESRIRFMLQDSEVKLIVSSSNVSAVLEGVDGVAVIEADDFSVSLSAKNNLAAQPAATDPAYLIYTSGSTGKPKGAVISHRNLADYYFGLNKYTGIASCQSFALVSTIATDLGNTVIFASLLSGGALHIFSKTSVSNAAYLQQYFRQQQIDCVKIVPSHWKALSTDDELLLPEKLIIFGGEALQTEVVEAIQSSGSTCRIVNHYGPTETTIGKLLHPVDREKKYESTIPIGKPFSNTRVYVLSDEMQLCPVGVPGQLYIGGHGVAKGYYNNRDLTASKFLPDPLTKNAAEGETMYATGDVVKWLPDGNISFIGRADGQIKIRGYRVEPGEVETVIRQSGMVNAAAVVAGQDNQGNNRLVAYIVYKNAFDKEDISAYLQEKLPEYMVPGVLMELDELPLTANGKIDRKALPAPEAETASGNEYVAPRNETEEKLTTIWANVLELEAEEVGIHNDFFALGGHSLLAVRLISAIRKTFQREIPIGDIFDYPTIAELATRLHSDSDEAVMPAITVQARPEHIPLSFSQERLWFIDQLDGSTQYHIPSILKLKGKPDTVALSGALQQVIRRHEALRTIIREKDGESYQEIQNWEEWKLQIENDFAGDDNTQQLQEFIRRFISQPFNLSNDYMVRAALIRLSDEEHILAVVLHHIASDGYSTSIMVNELTELYNATVEQRTPSLPVLPIQYADYAIWQRNHLQGEEWDKKLSYWKAHLQDVEPLQLPTDYSRPPIQSTKGATTSIRIDKQLSDDLQAFSRQQGVTIFMALLAALKVLLHRYSGQQDICVGTPIAGRQQQELEGLIGFFINTLALRSQVEGNTTFINLLQQVKATTLSAYDHQDVPFEKVVEAVVKERDMSRSPLFQVMLILQNTPEVEQLRLGELQVSQQSGVSNHTSAKFDLTFNITESTNGLAIGVEYVTDIYTEATVGRMLSHFTKLLHSVIHTPALPVGALPILSADEENELLVLNNNTTTDYPKDKTLVDLIEAQAAKTPDAIAVAFGDEQHTYRQLNTKANQLAHYLRKKGVQPKQLVPLCIERRPEMMVGLLGILKAGAAYVPIDPEYPADRIRYMLEDSGASLVVSTSNSSSKIQASHPLTVIELDSDLVWRNSPQHNPETPILPNHLAYVIYTSGSTGKPKGVMIEHSSVVNLLTSIAGIVQFKAGSSFLSVTTYSFDIAYLELYMPLLFGGRVMIASKEIATDGLLLSKRIAAHRPTHIQATPSTWQMLLDSGWENNESVIMLIGGEAVREEIKEALVEKGNVYNCYGPTETTIWSATKKLEKGEKVSIGKPIANTNILILNNNLALVPAGVAGEICIGGAGLARGYFNQSQLTEDKFITSPFEKNTGGKLYRTGDLGRLLPNGDIEYLSRIDTQVKVRGYRIELGEIENVLEQSDWVVQAVVQPKKDAQGNTQLVGYLVPNGAFNQAEISNFLKEKLPAYMVPSLWVALESLPLTPNGKINRKALPDPDMNAISGSNYVAPKTEIEKLVAAAWQKILGINRIGVHDDFFALGGHSLLAIRLVASIRKQLQVELTIKDLFYYPTIAELAVQLEQQYKASVFTSGQLLESGAERIPLSFSQERLWFIDQLSGSLQYHIPIVIRLQGTLDKGALSYALQQIVERHEVLRTVILQNEGVNYQYSKDAGNWNLQIVDGSLYTQNAEGVEKYVKQRLNQPFHLSEDYMLRADLLTMEEQDHLLLITIHAIAADRWSLPIFIRELTELYTSYTQKRSSQLAPLPIRYADYAIRQRNYWQGVVPSNKLQYWKDKLEGTPALQLPTNFARPALQSAHGSLIDFSVDKKLADAIEQLGNQHGATLFMTLLATFKVLLYRYSGQQDICVGTQVAGRQQEEVKEVIGFFANTLALRTEVNGADSFTELLAKVKRITAEAYEHQEVPFEKVVEAVVKERDLSRSPLFQAIFGLQDTPEMNLPELSTSINEPENNTSKFDIHFSVTVTSEGLKGSVTYCTDLFKEQTITNLIAHYQELLQSVIKAPQRSIGLLPMLRKADEELILGFNNPVSEYPAKSIIDLFEDQVALAPDNTALIFENETLTYAQLNERSNQLAHYLKSKGVKEETLVPLCIERSMEMIVSILAILKAGGAYVPIDPQYPQERISYMLQDTGASIIVSSKSSRGRVQQSKAVEIIEADGHWETINRQPVHNLPTHVAPHNLAYIIYTSGSTGSPKGVMVEHKSVVNLVHSQSRFFGISSKENILHFSNYCFDASVEQIFLALLNGASLILFQERLHLNIKLFENFLKEKKITHLHATPSFLENVNPVGYEGLKRVIAGGDICKKDLLLSWKDKVNFYNEYGPTETTVTSIEYDSKNFGNAGSVPIGRPVANTNVYIVSKDGLLCPLGVAGEICISGVQVARGYLNLPELTAEKFISDPFRTAAEGKMYKTGDIGRWLPDGNIEYLERIDDQVKIRGYRIELGEIENKLQQSGLVRGVVVLARANKQGMKRLIGYVVVQEQFVKDTIIAYLRTQLPEYMVPQFWVPLEKFPLTTNGKINRKALPDPDVNTIENVSYVMPRNQMEAKLIEIWEALLGINRIGVQDDFFSLGGNSLLAIRLVYLIRKQLQVELTIKDLFYYPTIAELAAQLKKQHKGLFLPSIEPSVPRPEHIPLSFSQERLWFIDQLSGSVQYHIPIVVRLQGTLDKGALSYALQQIVQRHEVLRTVVREKDGIGYQYIKSADSWVLEHTDGKAFAEDAAGLQQYIHQLIGKTFTLSEDYLLRATVVELAEQDHILITIIHHLASDGWSTPILVNELAGLYTSWKQNRPANLAALPIQYADYAIWQRNYLQGEVLETKLQYWKDKLEGTAPLQLPADKSRTVVQSNNGALTSFRIEKELVDQLQSLSRQHGATLFMTLLAAFKVLLYRYSGQQDICVGTPVAGRQQEEVEELIGFFVNTLALRTEVSGDEPFMELLAKVKRTTAEAYEHQEVPFEKVVEAVVKERDLSRSPLFQIMFGLQNTLPAPQIDLGELQLSGVLEASVHTTSKFDLSFNIGVAAKGLDLSVEYATDLFSEGHIHQLIRHYETLLRSIIATPQQSIGLLPMLSSAEEQQILLAFNNTVSHYPVDKTIVDLFEEQVALSPAQVALVFEKETLTYTQLNERSNQLARYLQFKGVAVGTPVAIGLERSAELIITILAILKAGGIYVPLDVHYPIERIRFMLQDTAASIIVCSGILPFTLPTDGQYMLIDFEKDWDNISRQPTANIACHIKPDSLAYIMYTSGSTGTPKGVQVTHNNVVSLVKGVEYVSLLDTAILLSTGATSFDATTFEYWAMLLNGGQLVLSSEDTLLHPELLKVTILNRNVSMMWFTSSWFNQLVDTDITLFAPLQTVLVGGEKLSEYHIGKLQQTYPAIEIINGYGPTENTTFSLTHTISEIKPGHSIPIGRPLSNRTAVILDQNRQLVPVGVSGEIYLGGAGISAGYLHQPELTAATFVKNPFEKLIGNTLYKTGDRGRWLADGNIEYEGRLDNQVKLRGYRIELGEIENAVRESGLVSSVSILVREDVPGAKKLVGYVVADEWFDKESLTASLHQKLPEYMVPAIWVKLENLPLTHNGKVDKKALPDPDTLQLSDNKYEAPRNELETELVVIWQDLLEVEKVGINDNFFDLGGHSLYAIRLVSLIQKKMGLNISINDVFIHPTISGLISNFIDKIKNPSLPDVNIKYLVPVKTSGSKPPLYLMAGGGGTALKIKKFAELLNPEQPVYVFQPPVGRKEMEEFPGTIEEIAAVFIEELLIHNPEGPYDLSGHCLGGIIAFEMAKQLKRRGKKVHLLAMLDTIIRKKAEAKPAATIKNLYHIPFAIRQTFSRLMLKISFQTFLLRNHTRETITYKVDSLKQLHKRLKREKPKADNLEFVGLEVFDESSQIYVQACKNYSLTPYDGEMVLFYATERYYFFDVGQNIKFRRIHLDEHTKNLWKEYSTGITIHEVKGEHADIFNPEHGEDFAQLLQKHLDLS